jgi:large subunit ribosomal protein L10
MPNQKNIKLVEELQEKLSKAKSVVFAEYSGLDANKLNSLRKEIRETGAEISIAKNTLMKKVLERDDLEEELSGQICTIFSYEDAISPLKKLVEFVKNNELPVVKLGIIDGVLTSASQIVELSKLPSREELIAQIVGGLKSPLSGIVNVLSGPQRKLVYALSAIAEKKKA